MNVDKKCSIQHATDLRLNAIRILESIGNEKAKNAIKELSGDRDSVIGNAASKALKKWGNN
jgi:HEAT repeat protein